MKYFIALALVLTLVASACTPAEKSVVTDTFVNDDASAGDTAMKDTADPVMEDKSADTVTEGESVMTTYSGTVLAGTTTPYIEFNKEDYDKSIADGKTVVLNFYATWCPSCKGEDPIAREAFAQLDNKNAVGFRVNYKDSNTDADETALAKEFGIAYQHTKVVIRDGAQVLKSPESWSVQRYKSEVAKYT